MRFSMVRIAMANDTDVLILTEGYIPELEELTKVYPGDHQYRTDAVEMPDVKETALAWLLTAYAQRAALRRGYKLQTDPPMETWCIAPPSAPSAKLATWFEGMPAESYRLMVHRSPVNKRSQANIENAWDYVYDRLPIRHRNGQYAHLKSSAFELIEPLLEMYQGSHAERVAVFDETGHKYAFSQGLHR